MEARQQYPNYDYSTLEVAQQNHGEHGQAPPQQQPDHSQQGYAQQFEGHNLPQVVEPTYPEVVPKPEEAAVTGTKGDFAGYQDHQHVQHPVPAPAERRIWGLKRKTFFILLAVILLVVIAAAVGGGVGGTVGKNGEKKSDPATGDGSGSGSGSGGGGSSGNTTSQSPVLANSGLNAIHWTDSSNVQYNAVFWQAKTHDLMMSLWDSDNKTWELVNITDKMAATSIDVTPKPGTPLAAAARGYPWTSSKLKNVAGAFGIALFYLSPQNTILEIYSVDPRGAAWGLGDLTTSSTNSLKTAPNSQLGAWWGLCEANCSGTIALLYEDDGNALRVANSTDWGTFTLGDLSDGASLAITACSGNFGRDGPAGNSVRLYYEDSNKLSELKYTPGQPWYYGSDIVPGVPTPGPEISATGFDNAADLTAGPINILVSGVYANGSAFATYWDNTTWHDPAAPILQGKVITNFTSVSVFDAVQLKVFGLTNESEIHSYTIDRKNPLSWTYDQAVITG